jgi:hypothetical protein
MGKIPHHKQNPPVLHGLAARCPCLNNGASYPNENCTFCTLYFVKYKKCNGSYPEQAV